MKVSLNLLKQLGAQGLVKPIDELVEKIGAQLGAVESVINLGEKYKGIVVAKVISCQNHPDADKLKVCTIDDGANTPDVKRDANRYVQVVCGAPNVREGMLVAWIPPGAVVPSSFGKEPYKIEARDIRGTTSHGMLASPKELALGDSHEGLLEIDVEAKPGDDFAKVYQLDDYLIDIENKMFTHRPDCFGHLGVGREATGVQGIAFSSPDWYKQPLSVEAGEGLALEVRNELPELVPRFTAVVMSDVSAKPSPGWLQSYLMRLGLRPINHIVDITNYFMLVTGQPLHAYDYDKVKALDGGDKATIVVRNPHQGEKLTLLNGKEVEPRPEAILIATATKAIGLGGVMGGNETEVDENTKNIILESANFDMYAIRRTSMAHGLFTDAATRFTKGQSPLQTLPVLAKVVDEIRQNAGGKLASKLIDDNHVPEAVMKRGSVHPPVQVAVEFINSRLGLSLSAEEMKKLLENVEFTVTVEGDKLTVTAPFWRTDVEIREDVVEEVGRLYGYDKLPLELPKRDLAPAPKDPLLELKSKVRDVLSDGGANEVLTYSFVHGNLLEKAQQNPDQAFRVSNALSPDLQYFRLSLTPSLLEKVHPNIKAGYDEFAIYEIGKAHNLQHATTDDGLPTEFEMLDLVFAASDKAGRKGAAFYQARKYLERLAASFGLELTFEPIDKEEDYQVVKPYDHSRSARVNVKGTSEPLGMIGEYKASVAKSLKLPKYCAGFGIGLTQLQAAAAKAGQRYAPLPRFPKVEQDITLKVPAEVSFQQLHDFVSDELAKTKPEHTVAKLNPLDIFQRPDDTAHKQFSFRLSISSYQKTLTDAEVNSLLDQVAVAAKAKFGAERV